MANKEDPKVHCIVLNKLSHYFVQGETEWKLCKVFSTLSNSNRRIHREKSATRKYKPVLAFTVQNPSDTDRQTLNFNKGVVKDRLGFSVNSETVAALIDGVREKETQWVMTTNNFLQHFSMLENLTVDNFFESEFEEAKLEGSLPSLFKLQSVCNRTEVVLASPIIKPQTGEGSSKKPQSSSKSTCSPGKGCRSEETLEEKTLSLKVIPDLVPTKSESDGNCSLAQNDNDDVLKGDMKEDKKLLPVCHREKESNSCLKCGHLTKEKQGFTRPVISKIKEELPESSEYDCKPKFLVKVKEEVCEHDLDSKHDPVAQVLDGAMPQVITQGREDVPQHDQVPKLNSHQHKPHSSAGNDRNCAWKAISERRKNVSETNHQVRHHNHSGDSFHEKKCASKVKEILGCSHIDQALNETHPIQVSGEASAQKTNQELRSNTLENCHKTKASRDSNKRDECKHPGSLEGANLSEQSSKTLASLTAETSLSNRKKKRKTSSDRDTASPNKPLSSKRDSTIHMQVSTNCPGKGSEKRLDSQNNNVAEITKKKRKKKSRTDSGLLDSEQRKGSSKRPLTQDLPSTKSPRKKQASDSMSALKVDRKQDLNSSKLKNHRDKLIRKHAETGAEVESCSKNKGDGVSHSARDVPSRAGTSDSPVKRSSHDSWKDECGDIKRRKHNSGSIDSPSKLFQGKSIRAAFRSVEMDSESEERTTEYAEISHEDKNADMKASSNTKHIKRKCNTKKNHGKPHSTTVRSPSKESGSTKAIKEFDKITSGDKISNQKLSSKTGQSKKKATAKKDIIKNPSRLDAKQKREDSTCGTKECASFNRKDESGDNERRTQTSASTNCLSKTFQGKSQPAAFRSLSMDSENTKTTAESARISCEEKMGDMKSSNSEQVKENDTAEKDIVKIQCKTQLVNFKSFSVESGSTKTVKDFNKVTSGDKTPNLKSPSATELSKGNGTAKKGVRFNENMSAVNGETMRHGTTYVDPQSAGFDLLDSLNTGDSFLFNSEYEKEQSPISALVKAVNHSGLCGHTDSNEVKTCNSPVIESTSKDKSFSYLDRSKYFLNKEQHNKGTKRQRQVDQHLGDSYQNVPRKVESDGKGTERQSSVHREDPGQQSHRPNIAEKQRNENRHAQQKNSDKEQSHVTLLVGDSMLQHIQPEKFFKTKRVVVRTVPGARVDNISEYISKFVQEESPSDVILHVGTNDLQKGIMHIVAHIESVGTLITKTFPSVNKFTISSIIHRREDITDAKCAKVSDVNKILRNFQLEHGWDYIDNKNIDPEVHLGPDGIHLNAIGIEAFAAYISKHFGLGECGVQQPAYNAGHVTTDQLAIHGTSKDNGKSPTSCKDSSSRRNACDKELITLLAGDSMLESVELQEDSTNTRVKCFAVPNARVNTFGNIVIELTKHHKVGEVILHIGSNDLNDNMFTPKEIAAEIEQIGVNIQKTCSSKITICGTISRNRGGADDVNSVLKTFQSKHGWGYICNDNVTPIFHKRPFEFKLKDPCAKIFEENVIKYLRSLNLTGTCSTGLQVSVTQQGNVSPREESYSKVGTSCEEDAVVKMHMGSDCLLQREPNGMVDPKDLVVPKNQSLTVPEATIEDTDDTALLHAKICEEASSYVKTNLEQEKVTLLIGDSMLESIKPQKLTRTKPTKLVVVPDARVDNIGATISKHAKNSDVDEVILHIGSEDLKDDIYTHREIAKKIEAIGLTLETTCLHITTFTISGVIENFDYKRANSRNLNTLLKSSTLDHDWAYISNDNIYPTFHLKPFETKLNTCGTRLLALNIIGHLRYMKSKRFKSVSQAPGMQGNNDQSSCKDARPELVPGKANKVPLKDPQADKRPPKDLKADKFPQKDLSRKEPCDGLGSNSGDCGQSQICSETPLKSSKGKKHKRRETHKNKRKTSSPIPLISHRMRVDEYRERPGFKSWPQGANRFGYHPGHNYDYSSAWYSHRATCGPAPFNVRIPSSMNSGWYYR